MMKHFALLFTLLVFTLKVTPALLGQALPTATRNGGAQIGATYLNGFADYTQSRFNGLGAYADLDLWHGLGVEAEFHYITDLDDHYLLYQRSLEIGARYSRHYGRFQPYAKVMVGRGTFNFLTNNHGYNLYAAGVGTDIRVYRSINVRVEDEFQKWLPGSGPGAFFIPHGLSPTLPSAGIAYRF